MEEKYINRIKRAKHIEDFIEIMRDADDGIYAARTQFLDDTIRAYQEYMEDISEINGSELLVRPGLDIVICGRIGLAGSAFMLGHYRDALSQTLTSSFLSNSPDFAAESRKYVGKGLLSAHGVSCVLPVCERGIYRELFTIGKESGLGYRVDYSAVPVSQYTIEFCEIMDMDPWHLLSGGCCIILTERGNELVHTLISEGYDAALIGYMTDDKDKIVHHREVLSRVNRPTPDEILELLKKEFTL